MSFLKKIISIASPPLSSGEPELDSALCFRAGDLAVELLALLKEKNGFYAFEGALHLFPTVTNNGDMGLNEWNDIDCWRYSYDGLDKEALFFGEDIFGVQFCIKDNRIYTFDPETADFEFFSTNFEMWAKNVLKDYEVVTGYKIAHEWQSRNGKIPSGKRLIPKIPFVVGGEFSIANLYLDGSIAGMIIRSEIAKKINGKKDGSAVLIKSSN